MTIDIRKYILIRSAVLGAGTVPSPKLTGRIFTANSRIPPGGAVTFTDPLVLKAFLSGGAQAGYDFTSAMAEQYFAWISNSGTSAQSIDVARWVNTETGPIFWGGNTNAKTVAALNNLANPTITIYLNAALTASITYTVASLGAVSLADAAGKIQAGLLAASGLPATWSNLTCVYDATNNRFVINTGQTVGIGTFNAVSILKTPFTDALGLTGDDSALLTQGSPSETPAQSLARVNATAAAWGRAIFSLDRPIGATQNPVVALADAIAASQWIESQNGRYGITWVVNNNDNPYATWYSSLNANQGTSLAYDNTTQALTAITAAQRNGYIEMGAATQAAATDYALGRNVTSNYMYKDLGILASVFDTDFSNLLDAARCNYVGQTEFNGLTRNFYQRGVMCGSATEITDEAIFTNEQWLRGAVVAVLGSAQLSLPRIPANLRGESIIIGLITQGVIGSPNTQGTAFYNGVIEGGKTLTAPQIQAITEATGDATAWNQVQSKGWFLTVTISPVVNPQSGLTEYQATYVLVYAKGDSIKKINGTHDLV